MTATHDAFRSTVLNAREHIATTLQDPFNADAAVLFLLDADGKVHELSRYEDVYSGLQETSAVTLHPEHVAVGVMTTGWAAPITDGNPTTTPPSEHPARERVQLCVACDRSFRIVSVVQFSSKDEPMVEESGEGPLADALAVTLVMMLRRSARDAANV